MARKCGLAYGRYQTALAYAYIDGRHSPGVGEHILSSNSVFTEKEEAENQESKLRLIEIIRSNQALLLVGAGTSLRLKYANWQELLVQLEDVAINCHDSFKRSEDSRLDNPLAYAQSIKCHIVEHDGGGSQFYAAIDTLYQPKEDPNCQDFHVQLVSLPFKAILTTNYDVVLESAVMELCQRNRAVNAQIQSPIHRSLVIGSDNPSGVSDYFLSLLEERPQRTIAHLHGIYNRADSIILTKDEYDRFYGTDEKPGWTMHRKLVWSIFATRRTIFIGYSITHDPLDEVLDILGKDLWRWGSNVHVAVLPITLATAARDKAKRKKLQSKGIDVYFYEAENNDHSALDGLVNELALMFSSPPSPTVTKPDFKPVTDGTGTQTLREITSQFELVSDRFEKIIKSNDT